MAPPFGEQQCPEEEVVVSMAADGTIACAKPTIQELQRQQFRKIDIPKLMPAFMNIQNQDDMELALDYIHNFCITKRASKSKQVHNMAFYFHSKLNNSTAFLDYLEQEEAKQMKGHAIYFEVE